MTAPLNPQQFPVKEIMGAYSPEYDSVVRGVGRHLDSEQIREYMRREPGHDHPVDLGRDEEGGLMLLNGHHRVIAANRRRARTIPAVVHPLVDDEHPTFYDKLEQERRMRRIGAPTLGKPGRGGWV